jgi:hypothetical protein
VSERERERAEGKEEEEINEKTRKTFNMEMMTKKRMDTRVCYFVQIFRQDDVRTRSADECDVLRFTRRRHRRQRQQ